MSGKGIAWAVALGIILWLFILGAIVPWITDRIRDLMDGLPV